MRNHLLTLIMSASLILSCSACASAASPPALPTAAGTETHITLSDAEITVDGAAASTDPTAPVYTGAGIIYYEAGHDETYGEGTEADAHTPEEATAHTVVTITQPGTYRVTGTMSAGQLAVDLGEGAEENPDAVVTLILDGVDITCQVAPAVIFYQVYECGSADADTAAATVDTAAAGANIVLADGSVNYVNGSYVAKIYQEGTDKKLHKYDGAFYSKMSMNVTGGPENTGELYIIAANEGLDSELHLTINGGNIWIEAQNDGINTNEDGVSVTTINGGALHINAGLGAEGDGIDSNGFLVINGGEVITLANGKSGDGGLDSDSGIYLNGGTVIATGSRNDSVVSSSEQLFIELSFAKNLPAGSVITLSGPDGTEIMHYTAEKELQTLTFTSSQLALDTTYTVAVDGVQQQYTGHRFGMGGGMGGQPPQGGFTPDGGRRPQDGTQEIPAQPSGAPEGQNGEPPQPPEGFDGMERPNSMGLPMDGQDDSIEPSTAFTLNGETHSFSGISSAAA